MGDIVQRLVASVPTSLVTLELFVDGFPRLALQQLQSVARLSQLTSLHMAVPALIGECFKSAIFWARAGALQHLIRELSVFEQQLATYNTQHLYDRHFVKRLELALLQSFVQQVQATLQISVYYHKMWPSKGVEAGTIDLLTKPQPTWLDLGSLANLARLRISGVPFVWLPPHLRTFQAEGLALHGPLPHTLMEYEVTQTDGYQAAHLFPDLRTFGLLPLRILSITMRTPRPTTPNDAYFTSEDEDGDDADGSGETDQPIWPLQQSLRQLDLSLNMPLAEDSLEALPASLRLFTALKHVSLSMPAGHAAQGAFDAIAGQLEAGGWSLSGKPFVAGTTNS
ncbi:hypothetical protein WJX72_004693 [[Myrmecia] bisecta]|uniref:Uncharacterized protein n=1 Tax=[Myrmecia] bisecta TaxID=41462 RepID=A0AAW1R627_9CHLO